MIILQYYYDGRANRSFVEAFRASNKTRVSKLRVVTLAIRSLVVDERYVMTTGCWPLIAFYWIFVGVHVFFEM